MIRKTIAITLIVIEIVKLILIARSPVRLAEYLPLEMCSFAGYSIMFDSFIPDTFILQMLLILFLPAATMALFFPTTSKLPAINFYVIHQFFYHGLIVAYVVARFASGEIPLHYPNVWSSIFTIIIIVAIIYVIDTIFDCNYMFLRSTYNNPLLDVIWNVTKGGIRYTFGLIVFSIFMIHVFFVIFKLIAMIFGL